MKSTNELVNEVKDRKEAEKVVGELLRKFSSNAAFNRVYFEAKDVKQTPAEIWKRRVTNLFTSLETRRG